MLTQLILAALVVPSAANDKPGYRVLAQDRGRLVILDAKGGVEWEVPVKFTIHDVQMLPNGNVLFQTSADTVVEMSPEKKVVWTYVAKPKAPYSGPVEVHAYQRLDDGLTLVAETGNLRLVEVDKDGKVVRQIPLTVDKPNPHRDTRLARKLPSGNYLVCHEGDGAVREYDQSGKVVWSYLLDLGGRPRTPGHDGHGTEVFGAVRLPNGNTLIAGGNNNRVLEVSPSGAIVWKIDHDELPGIRLFWVTTLEVLPNGNVIIGNCHAGDNPQLIEVTRDKKVVWTLKNRTILGNDTAAAQVLGVQVIR